MLFYCCVHVVLCHWRASWYKPSRNHLKTCASKLIVVSIANYNHNNNKKQQTTKKEPIHNIRLKSGSLRVPIDCSHSCIRSIDSFFLVVVVRCIFFFCNQTTNWSQSISVWYQQRAIWSIEGTRETCMRQAQTLHSLCVQGHAIALMNVPSTQWINYYELWKHSFCFSQ